PPPWMRRQSPYLVRPMSRRWMWSAEASGIADSLSGTFAVSVVIRVLSQQFASPVPCNHLAHANPAVGKLPRPGKLGQHVLAEGRVTDRVAPIDQPLLDLRLQPL